MTSAAAVTITTALTAITPGNAEAASAAAAEPLLQLVVAQKNITLTRSRGQVFLDPGIWVASRRAPLELRVSRKGYSAPLQINQILRGPSGSTRSRRLPASVLPETPVGLKNFLRLTVKDQVGTVKATLPISFCPNTSDPARLTPTAPNSSPYPLLCGNNPFMLGHVWGVQKDWAADPTDAPPVLPLTPGKYEVTATITPAYVNLFHIPAAHASSKVEVTVVDGQDTGIHSPAPTAASTQVPPQAPPLSRARTVTNPPKDSLPDMIALPAWDISTGTESRRDLLNFAAAVWASGDAPLDIQAFRKDNGSLTMDAYQYFWRNGKVIGQAPAGSMGFESDHDHDHWHYEQFARYRLLDADQKSVVKSQKTGFCIAPTDPINLLLPHAPRQPVLGFAGRCGSPTALWVRQTLPVGWGDTYPADIEGQAFDITSVPNGTYYVEITANPQRVLHERSLTNDRTLRKVILGGAAGNRSVKVSAWHGIDG
ncbi:lysyl oxidase family protein [Actinomadura napierensis]